MAEPKTTLGLSERQAFFRRLGLALDRRMGKPDLSEDLSWLHASTRARAPSSSRFLSSSRLVVYSSAALALGAVVLFLRSPVLGTQEDSSGALPRISEAAKEKEQVIAASPAGEEIVLAGGSVVHLDYPGALLLNVADEDRTLIHLDSGVIDARIVHQEGKELLIDAGPYRVRVTGTRFRLAWSQERGAFELLLTEGSVEIYGPEGVTHRVSPGQRCHGDSEQSLHCGYPPVGPSPVALTEISAGESKRAPGVPRSKWPSAPREPDTKPGAWRIAERAGNYREALALAEAEGVLSKVAHLSLEELVQLGRVARLTEKPGLSRRCLLQIRARYPASPEAAVAAFLLGERAPTTEATDWFQVYLDEAPSGPLAEEALGQLMESHVRVGNPAAAMVVARSYLARYPRGRHAQAAERLLRE